MAKSFLSIAVKLAKDIDRANKKARAEHEREQKRFLKEEEREIKRQEREYANQIKQEAKDHREAEKKAKLDEKNKIATQKSNFKIAVKKAQESYDNRCRLRKELCIKYIDKEIK